MRYSSRKLSHENVITTACNFWSQIACLHLQKFIASFEGLLRLGGRYFGNFTVYTIHVQANVSECYSLDYVSLFVLVIRQYSVQMLVKSKLMKRAWNAGTCSLLACSNHFFCFCQTYELPDPVRILLRPGTDREDRKFWKRFGRQNEFYKELGESNVYRELIMHATL